MKPLKLTIQGLYSYQEKQIIDFSKLTQAAIFGIFGNVGCGKSSILEAITFALYGKTDRLNLSGDNRNYNMMNLKSNELLIDFEFMAGTPQKKYKSTVSGKRNSKRFEDVKALDRKAYEWIQDSWLPTELDQIEKVLELSYENFKRTIIIPQGKFQEFLQLGNKDRTQMMKELFDLEKFELYYKVASLENKNNEQLAELRGKIDGIGEISQDEINALKAKSNSLKNDIDLLAKEIEIQAKAQKDFEQLKQLVDKLKTANQKQQELSALEDQMKIREDQLKEYEYCKLNFEALISSKKAIAADISNNTLELSNTKEKAKVIEVQLVKNEAEFKAIEEKNAQLDRYKKEITELDQLLEIQELSKSTKETSLRIAKGQQVVDETNKKIETAKQLVSLKEKELTETKEKKPDLLKLSAIKEWFTKQDNIEKRIEELNDQNLKFEKQKSEITKSIDKILNDSSITINSKKLNEILPTIDKQILDIKNELSEIDKQIEHVLVQSKLAEYADALNDGEACPLCGSEHHPKVFNADDAEKQLFGFRKSKEDIILKINTIESTHKKVSEQLNKLSFIDESYLQTKSQFEASKKESSEHMRTNQWPDFNEPKKVEIAINQAKELDVKIQTTEKELSSLRLMVDSETRNMEKYRNSIEGFKIEVTTRQNQIEWLKKQITTINLEELIEYSAEGITEIKSSKLSEIKDLETKNKELSELLSKLREEKAALTQKVKSTEELIAKNQAKLEEINKELDSKLAVSKFNSQEKVSEIINQQFDVNSERKTIELFNQQKATNKQEIESLQKEINHRSYNQIEHEAINQSLQELNISFRAKDQELGSLNNQIKEKNKLLERQKELLKEKESLENRAENLKTMKQLFKGSGFVNYISTVHLQNICAAANERFFKLSGQKLSLEISEDNNFQVRDFMNGGKIRNVKTLSGGQTFQAALSLALALADSIQHKTQSKENFFFLDEGFGSLDKDSLTIVFDTLKTLRKENRIVGLISHVEEMQHEVDTHLKILFDEEKGSLIQSSI